MGKTVKNLDQFLTLDLDQLLTLETLKLGPNHNSTTYIYVYIYVADASPYGRALLSDTLVSPVFGQKMAKNARSKF